MIHTLTGHHLLLKIPAFYFYFLCLDASANACLFGRDCRLILSFPFDMHFMVLFICETPELLITQFHMAVVI